MNEFSTYEFVVSQRIEGKWLLARIGMITLYVCFALGVLLAGISYKVLPPLALLPVFTWILVFATWRFVSVDYEYSITSGELTFSKIYGSRSRRRQLVLLLRDAVRIAPLDNGEHSAFAEQWHPEREYTAVSSMSAPDIYYALFEFKDKAKKEKCRAVLYFEATARALQIYRFYNPSGTVMTQVSR